MLIPEEGAPQNGMDRDSLADEIIGRRAAGATATLVFDEALRNTARESGLLFEGVPAAAEPLLAQGKIHRSKSNTAAVECFTLVIYCDNNDDHGVPRA